MGVEQDRWPPKEGGVSNTKKQITSNININFCMAPTYVAGKTNKQKKKKKKKKKAYRIRRFTLVFGSRIQSPGCDS